MGWPADFGAHAMASASLRKRHSAALAFSPMTSITLNLPLSTSAATSASDFKSRVLSAGLSSSIRR